MDRLAALSNELTTILEELHREAARRKLAPLEAPLAWLDEANGWLNYELGTDGALGTARGGAVHVHPRTTVASPSWQAIPRARFFELASR